MGRILKTHPFRLEDGDPCPNCSTGTVKDRSYGMVLRYVCTSCHAEAEKDVS